MKIPIFIISCDRLEHLKRSVDSYYAAINNDDFYIVFVDRGTTYQPTLDYIKSSGEVYYLFPNALNGRKDREDNVNESIKKEYNKNKFDYYVVTDPDIELEIWDGRVLNVYKHILNNSDADVVGPQLKIDDIPKYYYDRDRVMRKHNYFWRKKPEQFKINGRWVQATKTRIDTTFGLYKYKKGGEWTRLSTGYRVCPPYSAKHLDWYLDHNSMTEDQLTYMRRNNRINHWSKMKEYKEYYDFIEIGTCTYDYLCGKDKYTKGISIEPVPEYFEQLPNKKDHKKINAAISNKDEKLNFFYIPKKNRKKYNISDKVKGWSRLNSPHPTAITQLKKWDKPLDAIESIEVGCISINKLIIDNNVGEIGYLKIDTEGHDCIIMNSYYDFLINHNFGFARKIKFESNRLSDETDITTVTSKFKNLGYNVERTRTDTILTKI